MCVKEMKFQFDGNSREMISSGFVPTIDFTEFEIDYYC